MRPRTFVTLGAALLAALVWASGSAAQRGGMFQGSIEDPAIAYTQGARSATRWRISTRSSLTAPFGSASTGARGYLTSALDALNLPADSQLLLFLQTSLQAKRIGPANPRALFFNDRVALGWVRDGDVIEVAAHDATQGTVFYTLEQKPPAATAGEPPQFRRAFVCLGCHITGDTFGVPGLLMFSATESGPGSLIRAVTMDHSTPLAARWGGWLVTGSAGGAAHLGNAVPALDPAHRRGPALGGRPVRARWLPLGDERHRRAAGVLAPDADDESADAHRVGSARGGSATASAVHVVARHGPASGADDERHRDRGRGLRAVRGRGPAAGPRRRPRRVSSSASPRSAPATRRDVRSTSST